MYRPRAVFEWEQGMGCSRAIPNPVTGGFKAVDDRTVVFRAERIERLV